VTSSGPGEIAQGLLDRERFLRALGGATAARAEEARHTGVVMVQLRRLRDINVELGYEVGDALLAHIAAQIVQCLRPQDVIGRISAAHFALLLPGLRATGQPLLAVRKIQRLVAHHTLLHDRRIRPDLVFGVAMAPRDASEPLELLRCADTALRAALATGTDVMVYSDCDDGAGKTSIALEHDLQRAIEGSELELHMQPKVDLDKGVLTGVEALCRWSSSEHGVVSPAHFVSIAERCGLIESLTLWTLNAALRECAYWQPTLPGLAVAVNLSPLVLCDPELPRLVTEALNLWKVPARLLSFEVTEGAVMQGPVACLKALAALRDAGIRLSLDDFGTGHSSLAYLRQIPVSELKIDRSFVNDMMHGDADRRLVQSVIDLAQNFELDVVAEGVEDEDTLDTLTLMGCAQAQGYGIAKPMPPDALEGWLHGAPWSLAVDPDQAQTVRARSSMASSSAL
jgi:diguanylate cyclase (GGDEF)-like protein